MGHAKFTSKPVERMHNRAPQREALLFPRGKLVLPATIHVAGIGNVDGREPFDNDGLKRGPRAFVLLKHTLSGSGKLRFEGRQCAVESGQTMMVTVPHDHRYWLPRGGNWRFAWICLHGHEALHICRHIIEESGPIFKMTEETLDVFAQLVLDVLDGKISTPAETSIHAYDLIMRLHSDTELRPTAAAHERPVDIERAIGFCRENLARSISIDDMARASGYSRFHFVRRFTISEGIPPSEFLRNERMSTAARLLIESELPISIIAEQMSFADSSYFSKVFKRIYGMPPKAFRHRA